MNPNADSQSLSQQLVINLLCNEFEREWQANRRPVLTEYLCRITESARSVLLRELIALDQEYRRQAGETPRDEDYGEHFAATRVYLGLSQPVQDEAGLVLPMTLGEYDLIQQIAVGGMGEVYLARHRRMNRTVAIKLLKPAVANREVLRQRFEREVQITAMLSHPNVVTAFDAREDVGVCYLVTEYMPGGDLGGLVRKHGPLALGSFLEYARQAACGLAHAHENGVVHRDVKPSNLLLDATQVVRVADWGLARVQGDPSPGSSATKILTDHGMMLGTVDYLSPEQSENPQHVTAAADIYSFGCTLVYLLTGRAPFSTGSAIERLADHRLSPPADPREARPEIPPALSGLILQMLAKKPEDRPRNMLAVVQSLDHIRNVLVSPWSAITTPKAHIQHQQAGYLKVLFAGVVVSLFAGAAWNYLRPPPIGKPSVVTPLTAPRIERLTVPIENPKEYQTAWAKHLGLEVKTTNPGGMQFIFIPPGTYRMGSPAAVHDRLRDPRAKSDWSEYRWWQAEKERTVTITKPFYLGRTEVTRAEFSQFIADTKHQTQAETDGGGWGYDAQSDKWRSGPEFHWRAMGDYRPEPDHAIGNISWADARKYCDWLTAKAPAGVKYRLPSESEWEYACRAGSARLWCMSDDENELRRYAVFGPAQLPEATASRLPNAWGLHDMHGNLFEWCDTDDPWIPSRCPPELYPLRGGNFLGNAMGIRSAIVRWEQPSFTAAGFRVLREIAAE